MTTSLRVLHLSTTLKGGAGIAATLLHENLRATGIDSILITIGDRDSSVSGSILSLGRSVPEKLRGGFFARLGLALEKRTFFSLGSSSNAKAISYIKRQDKKKTIIHIHNWFNLLSLDDISSLIRSNYKLVFTLHDERLYTGGCHYSLECNGFKSSCEHCPEMPFLLASIPRRNLVRAIRTLDLSSRNVRLITPSHWISERLNSSKLGQNIATFEIPNCLAADTPRIQNYINRKQMRIGVASMFPFSYIKGRDTVRKFVQFAELNPNQLQVFFMKDFHENEKEIFWDSLDFLLVSSRSDNSPNVIHEAHLRGIPVIASKVGGITELMESQFDILVDWDNCLLKEILVSCESVINQPNFNQKRRALAKKHHQYLSASLEKHLHVYQELKNQS